MKFLIVEDDLTSSLILQKLLSPYGISHIVNDGIEAVEFFKLSNKLDKPYDLICLDIMMPKMDGQAVLMTIRKMEENQKQSNKKYVNIIMTTALNDGRNILKAFKEQCEGYLVKPIQKEKLAEILIKLNLIK